MAFEGQRKSGSTVLYKQGDLGQNAASITDNLPHIRSVKSGINKWDPVHKSIFEVAFSIPTPIQSLFQSDMAILQQQVYSVQGLDALQKTTAAGTQRFYGVDVSYLNPTLDSTYADITVTFNLNLRDVTDNFVLKVFLAWERLSYDLSDGTRTIKQQYISDNMRIAQANRNGQVWRSFIFHHIMLTSVTGMDDLDYSASDAVTLQTTFRADYWDYDLA